MSGESQATDSKLPGEKISCDLRRVSTVNSKGMKLPLEPHQRRASVQMEPATKKMDSVGEEAAGELGGFGGLGINFYDHFGNKVAPQAIEPPQLPRSQSPQVPKTQSPRAPGTQKPVSPLPKGTCLLPFVIYFPTSLYGENLPCQTINCCSVYRSTCCRTITFGNSRILHSKLQLS